MTTIPLSIAASLYGLSELDIQPMRGGHFAHVYSFRWEERDYILRLTPPNEDVDAQSQPSLLAWMAYLATHGASVPAPLVSRRNNLFEVIPTVDGKWLATAFTRAKGVLSEELPFEQWNGSLFRALGKAIGKVHAIARHYDPLDRLSYLQWDGGGNLFNRRIQNEHWLKDKQARLLQCIQALPKPSEAYGLIHCDLHFGNFYIHATEQVVTLIDFDDCAYGWFSMDIAILLFDILVLYPGLDKEGFGRKFLRNFLNGYLDENPLSGFWMEQIPLFLKLLEINIYDMVAKFYPHDPGDWGKKFLSGRKERLENDLPYVVLDFASLSK
jgi:Ser/Thr protein kinase RdoA (MazF antagonist)